MYDLKVTISKYRYLFILPITFSVISVCYYLYLPHYRVASVYIASDQLRYGAVIDTNRVNVLLLRGFLDPLNVRQYSEDLIDALMEDPSNINGLAALKKNFDLTVDASHELLIDKLSSYFLISIPANLLRRYLPQRWIYRSFETLLNMDAGGRYYFSIKIPHELSFEAYVVAHQKALYNFIEKQNQLILEADKLNTSLRSKQLLEEIRSIISQPNGENTPPTKSLDAMFALCTSELRRQTLGLIAKQSSSKNHIPNELLEGLTGTDSQLLSRFRIDSSQNFLDQIGALNHLRLSYVHAAIGLLKPLADANSLTPAILDLEKKLGDCERTSQDYGQYVYVPRQLMAAKIKAQLEEFRSLASTDRILAASLPSIKADKKSMELQLLASSKDPGATNLVRFILLGLVTGLILGFTLTSFTSRENTH